MRVAPSLQHYLLTDHLDRSGQIHFLLGDETLRLARGATKEFVKLFRGHR